MSLASPIERMGTSVLDTVNVTSPCSASWDAMEGDETARFCAECRQNVYDLSQMTRAQAEALLLQKEGRVCVRYYRRADGRIVTRDCQPNISNRKRYGLALLIMFIGMIVLMILSKMGAETHGRWQGLRQFEPFHTVMEWIDPTPPPLPNMIIGSWID